MRHLESAVQTSLGRRDCTFSYRTEPHSDSCTFPPDEANSIHEVPILGMWECHVQGRHPSRAHGKHPGISGAVGFGSLCTTKFQVFGIRIRIVFAPDIVRAHANELFM